MPDSTKHIRLRKGETAQLRLNGRTYGVTVALGYDGQYDLAFTELATQKNPRPICIPFEAVPKITITHRDGH